MPVLGPLPPHRLIEPFLAPADHRRLLDWTLASEARFRPSRLVGGIVDPARRVSSNLRDLGEMGPMIEAAVTARLADLFAAAGVAPFPVEAIELELAHHGDGAHFAPHLDIAYGPSRGLAGGERGADQDRLVSAVYYFHAEPRGFAGGELRLHRFGSRASGEEGSFVDVAPRQNALLVFPSIALHEVRPVAVPSGRFGDGRFAVNIWLCRAAPAA
jgi:Rps23 Pro-64 3,4-dihydroxylase Tpa1-like proline 4-hydroxylase